MSRIKSRDTKPEMAVRSFLHQAGLRYRLHRRDLPGAPDLVFPKYKLALFVHGCFWHQHSGCVHSGVPASNRDYWKPKLERTKERDRDNQKKLRKMGWGVRVIWECEIGERRLRKLVREIKGA